MFSQIVSYDAAYYQIVLYHLKKDYTLLYYFSVFLHIFHYIHYILLSSSTPSPFRRPSHS